MRRLLQHGKSIFLIAAVCVVAGFLYVSAGLVRDLSQQERQRMQIWADATREIVAPSNPESGADIDFLLKIIQSNTTIPVVLTDSEGNILQHRNFSLPSASADTGAPSEADEAYLREKIRKLSSSPNVISIDMGDSTVQYLYYEDSTLLKRLQFYPYAVIAVMIAFILVVYFAMLSTRRAEQNKVWVGLSKETAHQLGTPISSLMAWMELLPDLGVDNATVEEMNKDVMRLSTIASRFSKIGSVPKLEDSDLNEIVADAVGYMKLRISSKVKISFLPGPDSRVQLSVPLFEWVMENLIKNAVDAMEGNGAIAVSTGREGQLAWVEVSDTGKGIPRKKFKTVFNPGYTTKKRGWGLGLALGRRIINDYHKGSLYVKDSSPAGTVFRISLPAQA